MDHPVPDRRWIETPFEVTSSGIAYRAFGDGPPLVLMHGGAGNWHHWVKNVDALATCFRVLAIDQPCYGDSAALPWETPVDDYLAVVAHAVDEMAGDASHLHLAGFSFGGFVAAATAVRLAGRTAALSITGGAGFGRTAARDFEIDSARRMSKRLGRSPTPSELAAMYKENLGKLMLWDKSTIGDWAVSMQTRNVARTRFDSRPFSLSDATPGLIGQLTCPVMVVYGEHDAAAIPTIPERFERCRAQRPDVRTELIPDCGHWAMYEAPEHVNALMLDFHGSVN